MAGKRKYSGYIEQRGDAFRISLCINGGRHRKTIRTRNRADAVLIAQQWEAVLRNQPATTRPRSVPPRMSELINLYETLKLPDLSRGSRRAYRDCLKPIRSYFTGVSRIKDPLITDIEADAVQDYMSWRRKNRLDHRSREVSNRTLNKDRTMLYLLFDLAEVRKLRAGNPVRDTEPLGVDDRRHCILTDDEYEKLLGAADHNPMLYTYVTVLGESGLRCESEALHLRWEDVDFKTRFLTVVSGRDGHRTKSGKTRKVPMTARLISVLKQHFRTFCFAEYPRGRSSFVFHHPNTRRHHEAGARLVTMRTSIANAAKRAAVPAHFRQHDLRHRRVTTWLAEGKPVHLVQQAMGHADIKTTMLYYAETPEPLLQLVAPLHDRGVQRSTATAALGSPR